MPECQRSRKTDLREDLGISIPGRQRWVGELECIADITELYVIFIHRTLRKVNGIWRYLMYRRSGFVVSNLLYELYAGEAVDTLSIESISNICHVHPINFLTHPCSSTSSSPIPHLINTSKYLLVATPCSDDPPESRIPIVYIPDNIYIDSSFPCDLPDFFSSPLLIRCLPSELIQNGKRKDPRQRRRFVAHLS